jgi:uncharacterized RDD family membrane protein YckC
METPLTQAPAPAQRAVQYAGFWKRFVAYIIDAIIIGVIEMVILMPLLGLFGLGALSSIDRGDDVPAGFILAFISAYLSAVCLIMIAGWLYFALMESRKGATLGKMALGIVVTDMNGNMVTFGRASGRYFGKIISSLTLGIGYIIAGFTQQKQALHDIIAGCLVINK